MFRYWALLSLTAAQALGQDQAPAEMKAREWFYNPPAAAKPATPPVETHKAPRKTTPKPPPIDTTLADTKRPEDRTPISNRPVPDRSVIQNVSNVTMRPLGLRYSISKRVDNDFMEVDSDTVFHSGDKVRVTVQSNDTGYLYIIAAGTSGSWSVLFPNKEINSGNNLIEKGKSYTIPGTPSGQWSLEGPAGTEKLFLVLSRRPEQDLEKLLYNVRSNGSNVPVSTPVSEEPKHLMIASNSMPINDALVNRIRGQMIARDLVFEKVDEATPGEKKEAAVYVVNTNRSADAKLTVDLSLKHQ